MKTRKSFHGAFNLKADAKRKEKKVKGFIRKVIMNGKTRYIVMTNKRKESK
jgi:hypothetical protein